MNENKLYCYLELSDKDNTISCEKQWRDVFVSYLSYILQNNYQLSLDLINPAEPLNEAGINRQKDRFIHLKILSNQVSSTLYNTESFSSLFEKSESIGIVKEPLENLLAETIPLRLFDFCPMDPETGLPIKANQLFEKENMTSFLSRISDLSFEINLLFNERTNQGSPYIYLAEASYELSQVRYSVKKELIKRGFQVLPEKNFPLNKEELTDHIQHDLKRAVLSVHFFGNNLSGLHPQTGIQMDIFQNSLAAEFYKEQASLITKGENITTDFRRIIWMPENPRIKNEKHLKFADALKHNFTLHAGSDLIRSSPEELKDIIIQKLSGHNSKADAAPSNATYHPPITHSTETETLFTRVEHKTTAIPQHGQENYSTIILPEETNFFQ